MDSDDELQSGADLIASFKAKGRTSAALACKAETPIPPPRVREYASSAAPTTVSRGSRQLSQPGTQIVRRAVAVRASPVRNPAEYKIYTPKETVQTILRDYQRKGKLMYQIKLTNGRTKDVSFQELLSINDGPIVLESYQPEEGEESASEVATEANSDPEMRLRSNPRLSNRTGFVDISKVQLSSDEDELASNRRKLRQSRLHVSSGGNSQTRSSQRQRRTTLVLSSGSSEAEDSDDSGGPSRGSRRRRKRPQGSTRRSSRARTAPQVYGEDEDGDEDEDSSDTDILRSDVLGNQRKRKRGRPGRSIARASERISRTGIRQSDRSTRAQNNMQEAGESDIYQRSDSPRQPHLRKVVGVKEVFQTLPRSNLFRSRHVEGCETCGNGPNMAPLVYCQGCSLAYHKNCLGVRATRDHLVTKIGDDDFVLQCRRCINIPRKKDPTAPDLSKCQDCNLPGSSCKPFRARKTTAQEQKDREDNGGQDPVIYVPPELINNAHNVLFRCMKCSRGFHYHHLPPLSAYSMDIVRDDDETAGERFQEYSKNWLCKDCEENKNRKVGGLIAWRPSDLETYRPGTPCEMLNEDDKQYLVKWEAQSYFQASWHSGPWTWGVTAPAMRKAFFKRETGPKMRTEDAIPEEFMRIDVVLDVKFTSYVDVRSEEIDKARIGEVDVALLKYKGLGYEDAVWEKVPTAEDGERWLDFVTAYNDWVAGRYIKFPKQGPLRTRLEKARGTAFSKLEKKEQPENLKGGELMKYQIDGLNWLYYQWYSLKNGILADEMGLGKTIQVIGFMATLVQEHNCFPFLIVVPNSTCANWRREIKQWVPSLRVVTYFGSSTARDMAYRYEMYPEGSKELRCHVVVTSYEAAADESCRKVLRGVNWAGLIVDEGQRLKNDKSQLYTALRAVKAPFRLLMTGTPLQNNARELFNLLQFLDETINAAELEEKYAEMTTENIRELHEQIRPYILRRTKAQVLTFLPPLGQIIVPVSMGVLQKRLYKSILARNPELLKALFTTKSLKQQERANLSNILMQLRKCLCHPFVYSREIEERTDIAAVSHRNLVEASAKLQFLELLLPKLRERGHRVLIFSQFLDMLSIVEDFLDGLEMPYQRLDGTMGSLEKQKRIDQFNAPESPLFAFLLSTRAGGVGINLATADTVIILDPDFNPHQDMQAVSRAHRIGQKKKVLCYQLMTRATVEEKIIQIGRKKRALDHVVVEQLDAEDLDEKDFESILKYGAAELFKDDNTEHDIRFDENSIEKLLDRSQIENTQTGGDHSAESQFSFARVWASDQGTLTESLDTPEEEVAPDPGVWDKILKERQAAAAAEALARAEALGRGKRARMAIDYKLNEDEMASTKESKEDKEGKEDLIAPMPVKEQKRRRKKENAGSDSDTDFQDNQTSAADSEEGETLAVDDLPQPPKPIQSTQSSKPKETNKEKMSIYKRNNSVKPFARAHIPVRSPFEPSFQFNNQFCLACHQEHPRGACPLKISGVEHCGLCGLAHYGFARSCPHINSETQVREMIAALKNSPEKKDLVDAALRYLRGVKGALVQKKKKKKKDRERASGVGQYPPSFYPATAPQGPAQGSFSQTPHNAFSAVFGALQGAPGNPSAQIQQHLNNTQLNNGPSRPPIDNNAVDGALRRSLER
ncbi:hypothetical protein GQ43DRAFT_477250 [Delitschia confertaspora ATCC 74209]|uniref:Uncharacterized protein n=1 Tax=Delitschia confertaspora ATCC 74209 TaxID=1513339 RepID=A0A9P4JTM5_9PLEO|nr:hypothetical protein GQ43DRAFT_477250 [Delitschia confertaspora ATCC 74209]